MLDPDCERFDACQTKPSAVAIDFLIIDAHTNTIFSVNRYDAFCLFRAAFDLTGAASAVPTTQHLAESGVMNYRFYEATRWGLVTD